MRYLLIALILIGCSPFQRSANRHLKLAERHLAKAKMKGAVIDDIVSEQVDTAKVGKSEVKKDIEVQDIDTVYLESNCDSLKSENPETKSNAISNIQKEVCPDIEEVITLSIPVTVNDSTYNIEVNASLFAQGGKLSLAVSNDPINITYVSQTVSREIKPDQSKDWQKYALGALAGIVLLLIALAFRR